MAARELDILLDINSRLRGVEQALSGLERMRSKTAGLGEAIQQAFAIDLVSRFNDGIMSIGNAFSSFVKSGVSFNSTLEDAQTSLAGVFRTFNEKEFSSFDKAFGSAGEAIEILKQKAVESPASFEQLVQGFAMISGSASSAGVSIRDQIDLVVQMSQTLKGLGLQSEQLGQEMRSIFAGDITNDTQSAKMLGITREDIERAKQAGTLVELLQTKMSKFSEAAAAAQMNFSTMWTNLGDKIQQIAGELAKPLFLTLKDGLAEVQTLIASPEFKSGLQPMFEAMDGIVRKGVDLLKNTDAIKWAWELMGQAGGVAFKLVEFWIKQIIDQVTILARPAFWSSLKDTIITTFDLAFLEARQKVKGFIGDTAEALNQFGAGIDTAAIRTSDALQQKITDSQQQLATSSSKLMGILIEMGKTTAKNYAPLQEQIKEFYDTWSKGIEKVESQLDGAPDGPVPPQLRGSSLDAKPPVATPELDVSKAKRAKLFTPEEEKPIDVKAIPTVIGQIAQFRDSIGTFAEQVGGVITGTIGTAVDSVTDGIMGLIDGTKTWGEALQNIGKSIVTSLIESFIRMTAQLLITRLVLGAFTGGAGFFAPIGGFASGGLIPGAPSRQDNRLAAVATGEYVVQSSAVERYGAGLFEALNNLRVPLADLSQLRVPRSAVARSGSAFATGGLVGPGQAGNGGETKVSIFMGSGNRNEERRFLESAEGQRIIVNQMRRQGRVA